jgi:hypothetical protein
MRRVGVGDRSRRYPPPLQDAADGGRCDAVAKLEQLAWILWYPQLGIALATRLISSGTAAETDKAMWIGSISWRPGDDASAGLCPV